MRLLAYVPMPGPVALVYGEELMKHRLSDQHPLQPIRVKLAVERQTIPSPTSCTREPRWLLAQRWLVLKRSRVGARFMCSAHQEDCTMRIEVGHRAFARTTTRRSRASG